MDIHPRVQKTLDCFSEFFSREYYANGLRASLDAYAKVDSFQVLIALPKAGPGDWVSASRLYTDITERLTLFRSLSSPFVIPKVGSQNLYAIKKEVNDFGKEFLVETTPALVLFLESKLNENKDDYVSVFSTWMMPYFNLTFPRQRPSDTTHRAEGYTLADEIKNYKPRDIFSESPNRPLFIGWSPKKVKGGLFSE